MKVTYKKRNIFYPVCFITAILLSVICFNAWNSGAGNAVSGFVNVAVSPLQYVADAVSGRVISISEYFASNKRLSEENRLLKEYNARMSVVEAENRKLKKQNDDLFGYLDLKRDRTDFKLCDARIIARTSSNYIQSFVIDKGTFHGVNANMPLINSDGALLGVVLSADKTSSKCLSVISYDVSLGVYNGRNGITGVLGGSFELFKEGKCSIDNLPVQSDIQKGDVIFTSGTGDIYPADLIIGTVDSITTNSHSHTVSAVVKPGADISVVDNIMVITDFERVYE